MYVDLCVRDKALVSTYMQTVMRLWYTSLCNITLFIYEKVYYLCLYDKL